MMDAMDAKLVVKRLKDKERTHRKWMREAVSSARYYMRHGDYEAAIARLAWALVQRTAADAARTAIGVIKGKQ